MEQGQHIGKHSNGNQQIRGEGYIRAPYATDGAISIAGDNHGILITSVPTAQEPQHTFDIAQKTRIPTPASIIGLVSGLITIVGFITGGLSIKQFMDVVTSGKAFDLLAGPSQEYWWLFGSILTVGVGLLGLSFFKFLRRNVLRLPKWRVFRAWAGIKEENGQTYPYSLRLAMRCPRCSNQELRFQQVPADYYDIINLETGARKKRVVTKWASMAVCPRNNEHSIPVDISGNDFDGPLAR